ncbi:uncharacterized protein LOC113304803 isoform X1 [Papaver somniferum]|uniref:uncharacterized protein LOC113304803 isoform X1 n=1 Tax=Papaver somniferum TaxID=3469 RepID=UPI000E705928|nr:uncharacterized protein LOC113304803 isoform X1 [Papaver somniferum]
MQAILFSTQVIRVSNFYCRRLQSPISQAKETQSLKMLLWVEYLRWKFKLFLTGWWSMFCEAGVCTQITAHFVAKLICALLEWLNQFEATNGFALILIKFAHWKFDRGKLFTNQYFSFDVTSEYYVPSWMSPYGNACFFQVSTYLLNVSNITGAFLEFHDFYLVQRPECLQLEFCGFVLRRMKHFPMVDINISFAIHFAPNGSAAFRSVLLLPILSTLVVQASGKFLLVFCHARLLFLVCSPTSSYLNLELCGRKQTVQLLPIWMHTLAVSKSVACPVQFYCGHLRCWLVLNLKF